MSSCVPHRAFRALAAAAVIALVAAASILPAGATAAGGFKGCSTEKLRNRGLIGLKASGATCELARQVAYATLRDGTESTPKGFICTQLPGGNLTPVHCSRGSKVVKFYLEG